jgi:DNA polymerase III epsilon subunit-like protein
MTKLCFVDTETMGLDPDRHEIWEVGLIIRNDNLIDVEYEWKLPVKYPENADQIALTINGYYDRQEEEYISPRTGHYFPKITEFAYDFMRLTMRSHLVGAVVSFDEERLRKLLLREGYTPMWHYHLVDVESLVAGKLGWTPPWKSSELWEKMGINEEDYAKHTALGDARLARDLYDLVMPK